MERFRGCWATARICGMCSLQKYVRPRIFSLISRNKNIFSNGVISVVVVLNLIMSVVGVFSDRYGKVDGEAIGDKLRYRKS